MKYILTEIIPATKKTTEVYVAPCIKCGSDNIDVSLYEDNSGPPISTIKCKICKREAKVNGFVSSAIKAWNKKNDHEIIIKDSEVKIKNLQSLISDTKRLMESRGCVEPLFCARGTDGSCDKCESTINNILKCVDNEKE